jgi:hypothetical protein
MPATAASSQLGARHHGRVPTGSEPRRREHIEPAGSQPTNRYSGGVSRLRMKCL